MTGVNGKRHRLIGLALAAVGATASAVGIYLAGDRETDAGAPTHRIERGEFLDYLELRGEVRAVQSVQITAPFNAGNLQIMRLRSNGEFVESGDVIVQFDTTTLVRLLQQKQTELKQAEAEIERARAQAKLQEEKSITEVTRARFDVERARLDADAAEILASLEGEKSRLALDSARQRLRELDVKLDSDRKVAEADVEILKQKREKVRTEVEKAQRDIDALSIRAPVSGVVTLLPNFRAASGGTAAPEFKPGDRAWAGASIAELPDVSTIQVSAFVDEMDRSRLAVSSESSIRVDAIAGHDYQGKIVDISALAKQDYTSWPPRKNFEVRVTLQSPDARLRPGMSASVRVVVERIQDALWVPVESVFQKEGNSIAFVWSGDSFEERPVEVARRSAGRWLVSSGLKAGESVALKDPRNPEKP